MRRGDTSASIDVLGVCAVKIYGVIPPRYSDSLSSEFKAKVTASRIGPEYGERIGWYWCRSDRGVVKGVFEEFVFLG